METETDAPQVFDQLKAILQTFEPQLRVEENKLDSYILTTRHLQKNKKPLYFGAVQIKKSYVSFHLVPAYVFPELLAEMSPALKRRMQGKACFNFRQPDAALFGELTELTRRGFAQFREAGKLTETEKIV